MMRSSVLALSVFVAAALSACGAAAWNSANVPDAVPSATWKVWQMRLNETNGDARVGSSSFINPVSAGCRMEGACDDPGVRDRTKTDLIEIPVTWIVLGTANGLNDKSEKRIPEQMDAVNAQWQQANIQFVLSEIKFVEVSGSQCLPAYASNNRWYNQIQQWKYDHGGKDAAPNTLHVYTSCQDKGTAGTLLGFGTFPWDKTANTSYGGIWMNSAYVSKDDTTLAHEAGHNLGLRHTFAGINEVSGCSDPCYEKVHDISDEAANYVGDWCADTRTTPLNYECNNPSGTDCYGNAWGFTPFNNYMGYSMDKCQDAFTDQQIFRAHCWTCAGVGGMTTKGCLN